MANSVSTQADIVKEGRRLIGALAANEVDLPHMELPRQRLQGLVDAVDELIIRQGALTAEKQDVTRQLQGAVLSGRALIAFVRKGVQELYGTRSEKLAEFGLQPFRGRPRRELTPVLPPTPPTPPTPVIE